MLNKWEVNSQLNTLDVNKKDDAGFVHRHNLGLHPYQFIVKEELMILHW
jgi:hypothetical protein